MAGKELNRKEYLKLKKMDHADMADYINAVYQRGFEEAKKEFVKTEQSIEDIKAAVEEVLNNIPGIGAKRTDSDEDGVCDYLRAGNSCPLDRLQ